MNSFFPVSFLLSVGQSLPAENLRVARLILFHKSHIESINIGSFRFFCLGENCFLLWRNYPFNTFCPLAVMHILTRFFLSVLCIWFGFRRKIVSHWQWYNNSLHLCHILEFCVWYLILHFSLVLYKNCFSVPSLPLCPKRVTDYRFMADYRFMTSSKLLHRYFHQIDRNGDRFKDWIHSRISHIKTWLNKIAKNVFM